MGFGKGKNDIGIAYTQGKHHFQARGAFMRNVHFLWGRGRSMAAYTWSRGARGGGPSKGNSMGKVGLEP